jgi:hypothetical protein
MTQKNLSPTDPTLKMNADPSGSGSWIYVKNKNVLQVKTIMLNFNENKVTINIFCQLH